MDPIDEDDGGGGSQEVLELRREVRTLKAHIQNNYNVYVKRLEKRKTRIKDLEEYSKLVVKDNETLTGQLQEAEGIVKIIDAKAQKNTCAYLLSFALQCISYQNYLPLMKFHIDALCSSKLSYERSDMCLHCFGFSILFQPPRLETVQHF